jgi:hypothetical protein
MSNFVMLRRLDDTSGSIRTTLSRQPGWLVHLQPGPAPNLFQLMKNAPVRDTVPDVSSSAAEPVTAVELMDDDDDDDDLPPGEVLSSDSPHVL